MKIMNFQRNYFKILFPKYLFANIYSHLSYNQIILSFSARGLVGACLIFVLFPSHFSNEEVTLNTSYGYKRPSLKSFKASRIKNVFDVRVVFNTRLMLLDSVFFINFLMVQFFGKQTVATINRRYDLLLYKIDVYHPVLNIKLLY